MNEQFPHTFDLPREPSKPKSRRPDINDTPLTSADHVHHVWREEAYAALNRHMVAMEHVGMHGYRALNMVRDVSW